MVELIERNGRDNPHNPAHGIVLTPAGPRYVPSSDPAGEVGNALASLKKAFAGLQQTIKANPIPADPSAALAKLEQLEFVTENLGDIWGEVDRSKYSVRFVCDAGKEVFNLNSHPNRDYQPGGEVFLKDGKTRKVFKCGITGLKIDDSSRQLVFGATVIEEATDLSTVIIANEV